MLMLFMTLIAALAVTAVALGEETAWSHAQVWMSYGPMEPAEEDANSEWLTSS